jgi:DnaJ-like protein
MTSPHDVLGVSRDADDETIRAAFRKAAKAYHPDLNDGSEAAARRFKQIAAARDALLKGPELRLDVNRRLPFGPRRPGDQALDVQEYECENRNIRIAPRMTAGGVMTVLLVACVISSAVVFLPQRGVVAAFEQAIAGVLDMKDVAVRGPTARADVRRVSIEPQDTTPRDSEPQPIPTIDVAAVPSSNDAAAVPSVNDAAAVRSLNDNESKHATVATGAKKPNVERDRHKGDAGDTRAIEPHAAKRAPAAPAIAVASRVPEAQTPAGAAVAGRAAVNRLPPQPNATANPRPEPAPTTPRPTHALNGCWTDEGHGRWTPCDSGTD